MFPLSEEGPRSSIVGSNLNVFIVFYYLYRDVNVTTMKWFFWMTGKYGSSAGKQYDPYALLKFKDFNYTHLVDEEKTMAPRVEGVLQSMLNLAKKTTRIVTNAGTVPALNSIKKEMNGIK